jgi:predicted  nucleic acid-binding Zn-ribbon protein
MSIDRDHPFSDLSNEELQEKEESLRAEIDRLNTAIGEEREEEKRLKKRLKKGDPTAQEQITEVREAITNLRRKRSTARSRRQTARRLQRQSSTSASAKKPSYGV